MLKDFINLGKHSAIYGLSNALGSAIGFFLIPLYTSRLSPAEYGIWELFFVVFIFLTIFLELGLGSALFKAVLYDSQLDERSLFTTAFLFLSGSAFVILTLLYLSAGWICTVLLDLPAYTYLLRLVLMAVFLNLLAIVPMSALRIREKSIRYGTISLGKFVIGLGLNIYFIAVLEKGIEGIAYAAVLQGASYAVFALLLCRKCLGFSFSPGALSEMLKFGLPLVFMGISFTILNMSDRYFLRFYASIEELGLYSIAYKIGMAMNIIVGSIQIAWPALMFKMAREKRAGEFFARSLTYIAFLLIWIWLLISLFTNEIFVLFTSPAYYAAHNIVPVILLSYLLVGVYYITAVGTNIKRKTHYQAMAATTACGMNLFLNYLLIPHYGMYGAAASTVFSFFVMTAISYSTSIRLFPVQYKWGRIGKIFLTAFALFLLSRLIMIESVIYVVLYKLVLAFIFPVLLYWFNNFSSKEKAFLQNLIMHKSEVIKSG